MTLRTHGDTEVLLETLRLKVSRASAELNGQFAFGYYDEEQDELLLARDRMGILPIIIMKDRVSSPLPAR